MAEEVTDRRPSPAPGLAKVSDREAVLNEASSPAAGAQLERLFGGVPARVQQVDALANATGEGEDLAPMAAQAAVGCRDAEAGPLSRGSSHSVIVTLRSTTRRCT